MCALFRRRNEVKADGRSIGFILNDEIRIIQYETCKQAVVIFLLDPA
jgi:hypothetical protein